MGPSRQQYAVGGGGAAMTGVVIKLIADAAGLYPPLPDPTYLRDFDPDRHDGRGEIGTTRDPAKALRFSDAAAALMVWKTQSRRVPVRPDGKPNRPLTAYTVEIVAAP
jgi:hypothetical protein